MTTINIEDSETMPFMIAGIALLVTGFLMVFFKRETEKEELGDLSL